MLLGRKERLIVSQTEGRVVGKVDIHLDRRPSPGQKLLSKELVQLETEWDFMCSHRQVHKVPCFVVVESSPSPDRGWFHFTAKLY